MFRFTRLGQKLGIVLIAALILFAIITATSVHDEVLEVREINEIYLRDARQALLSADFESTITRAAGEAVSFALTRRATYLQEAIDATAAARRALDGLQLTLGDTPTTVGLEGKHIGLLKRQHELLSLVEHGIAVANALPAGTEAKQVSVALAEIYAYEPLAEALHRDVGAHREAELSENQHQFRDLSRATLTSFALSFLSQIGLVVATFYLLRGSVVRPINRLAAAASSVTQGNLDETVTVTSNDEIGRLQTAFNKMVRTCSNAKRRSKTVKYDFVKLQNTFPVRSLLVTPQENCYM